jgi:beta-lactamase regulating signal transducer with metallopeptidase domain
MGIDPQGGAVHVVVNWLWQGVALTLLTDVAMRSAPRVSASARYVLWWVAMILVLLLPAMPTLVALSGAPPVSAAAPPLSPLALPDVPVWPLLAAVGCWVFWIAAFLARLSVSVGSLGRVRRDATSFPPGREGRLEHWVAARSSNGRSARLVLSSRVKSASVIGLGPALIAVSPEALERLTDDELDQVVLHEWAHVQRRDDYARLIQLAIRCIAGLHPAVWWIGRRLEIEREIACDDYAVNIAGGARRLAVCLTKLADLQQGAAAATLAPGVLLASQLTQRVRRLLDPRRNTSTRGSRAVLGSAASALTFIAIVLAHVELVGAASPAGAPTVDLPELAIPSPPPASGAQIPSDMESYTPVRATLPAIQSLDVPAGHVSQERYDAQSVASSVAPAPRSVDPGIVTMPLDRLERGTWPVPELPPLSSGLSPTAGAEAAGSPVGDEPRVTTPWGAAADAGISIGHGSQKAASATADAGTSVGRGSQKAAVATAGFFTRLSRKIADNF